MLRAVTLALSVSVAAPCAFAASWRAADDVALAEASAAAVHGRVVAIAAAWDPAVEAIYSDITLDVFEAWGLPGAPTRVVVKQLGGVVGDTALVIGGQAYFGVGEEVFVFLDVRPRDRTLSVAGLEQGKWQADPLAVAGAALVRERRGTDTATVIGRDHRTLAALRDLAALVGRRESAAGAVLAPDPPRAAAAPDAAAFTLLSPSTPARWHQADSAAPVPVDTQSGGHPQFAGGGLTQLSRAAALWTAPGSLRLQDGVSRTPRCFSNSEPGDGRISITYGDPCGEIADGSSTLAIGGAYFSSSDIRTVNGVSFWKITKGMVVTDNPPAKFSGMSAGCYEELLAHEIGHAIGFGHAAARPAVMYPAISSTCGARTTSLPLQADDLAAVAAVYPAGPASTAPGSPNGLGSTVVGSTVTIAWSAPATGGVPSGYQLLAGSAPGLTDIAAIVVAGTALVVPGVPNGAYYVRVVAGNAAGVSAPTADHLIRVGPAPPGPPRTLTASSAAGTVSLAWQPPSSGGAPTGYVLVAGYTPGASTIQIPIAGTAIVATGVPPATYYVRVVAVNAAGLSAPSNEVALTVP
ncbi:MAG: matrixin family metalloprotease [Vicinamibacterales bacterium]